jgi:hypothetical protein
MRRCLLPIRLRVIGPMLRQTVAPDFLTYHPAIEWRADNFGTQEALPARPDSAEEEFHEISVIPRRP